MSLCFGLFAVDAFLSLSVVDDSVVCVFQTVGGGLALCGSLLSVRVSDNCVASLLELPQSVATDYLRLQLYIRDPSRYTRPTYDDHSDPTLGTRDPRFEPRQSAEF